MAQRFNNGPDEDKEPEWRTALFFHSEDSRRHPLNDDSLKIPKIEISDRQLASLLIAEMQSVLECGEGSVDDLQKATELYRALPTIGVGVVPRSLQECALDKVLTRLAAGEVAPLSAFLASPLSWGVELPRQKMTECAGLGLERRWSQLEALSSLAISSSEKAEFGLSRLPAITRDMAYLSAIANRDTYSNPLIKVCQTLLSLGEEGADKEALKLVRLFSSKDDHNDLHRHIQFRLREALRGGKGVISILQLADELSILPQESLLKAVKVWSAVHWNKDHSEAKLFIKEVVRSEVFSEKEILEALEGAPKRVAVRELSQYRDFLKEEQYDSILHALSTRGVAAALTAPAYSLSIDVFSYSGIEILPGDATPMAREAKKIYQTSGRRLLVASEDEGVTGGDFLEVPLSGITSAGRISAEGRRHLEHRKLEAKSMDILKAGNGGVNGARLSLTKDGRVVEFSPEDLLSRMMELELLSTELYGAFFGKENGQKEKLLATMEECYGELLEIAGLFEMIGGLIEKGALQSREEIDRVRFPGHRVSIYEGDTPQGEIVFTVPMGIPHDGRRGGTKSSEVLLEELRTLISKVSTASY